MVEEVEFNRIAVYAKHFTGKAIELKRLETAQIALKDNVKYFVSPGTSLINVIGDATGSKIIPIEKEK